MQSRKTKRLALLLAAVQVVSGLAIFAPSMADASGQLTARSVSISDSTPSKTGVSYSFTLTPSSTATVGSIAFEFCNEDPLPGTTCTPPTGMTTTAATFGSVTGQAGSWSASVGTNGYPYVTRTAAAAAAAATTVVLNNITNPSGINKTYYLRILTFASATPSPLNATQDASSVDFGGVAWSTGNAITVNAKVQETINFCSYVTGTCAVPTGSTADLGILTTSQISAAFSKFEVATNAQSGATVQYFGATLTSGANTIVAAGGSASAMTAGTEKFGLNLASSNGTFKDSFGAAYTASAAPTGSAPIGVVAATPTDFTTANSTSFVASASAPVTTPSTRTSQTVAYSLNPINQTVYTVNYAAAISNLTKPGIYTTTVQYVATGTF